LRTRSWRPPPTSATGGPHRLRSSRHKFTRGIPHGLQLASLGLGGHTASDTRHARPQAGPGHKGPDDRALLPQAFSDLCIENVAALGKRFDVPWDRSTSGEPGSQAPNTVTPAEDTAHPERYRPISSRDRY
jgi:hypothetical protein